MRRVALLLLCALFASVSNAQSLKDIRINEVLVKNVTNYENDYGERSSWIELHNTGHARLKLAGCYLIATKYDGSTIEYKIPMDDPNAVIAPMGYALFYCSGNPHHGTWYTNFTLDEVKNVTLLNASKDEEAIATFDIDSTLVKDDVSIGYLKGEEDHEVIFGALPYATPNTTNDAPVVKPKYQIFVERDPTGVVLAVTAIGVVFSVLLALFILFKLLGIYMVKLAQKKDAASRKAADKVVEVKVAPSFKSPHTGEEVAAIVTALKLYSEDLHDKESTVLTINRVARAYSPWSSKIYGLRQNPRN